MTALGAPERSECIVHEVASFFRSVIHCVMLASWEGGRGGGGRGGGGERERGGEGERERGGEGERERVRDVTR